MVLASASSGVTSRMSERRISNAVSVQSRPISQYCSATARLALAISGQAWASSMNSRFRRRPLTEKFALPDSAEPSPTISFACSIGGLRPSFASASAGSKARNWMMPRSIASIARTARRSAKSTTDRPRAPRKYCRASCATDRPPPPNCRRPSVFEPKTMRMLPSGRSARPWIASSTIVREDRKSW